MTDPQRFNLYSYVRNNPLSLTDPTGEDIDFVNDTEEGRKRALATIVKNLSTNEAANIGIRSTKDGSFEAYVIDPGAIGKGASKQYTQLVGLIKDPSIVADVGLLGDGLTATFKQGPLAGFGSISSWGDYDSVFGAPGRRHVNVLATLGNYPGGVQVCFEEDGTPYKGVAPDYIDMWHELIGETLKYRSGYTYLQKNPALDSQRVIAIENETRRMHGLPPRTRADHGQEIITVYGKVQ
jgi:hypothetical protein